MALDSMTSVLAVSGNVIAVGAAALASWASVRTLRIERNRDRFAATKEQREQAARVSAWMSRNSDDIATTSARPAQASIEGRNASDLPIYNVRVYLWIATPNAEDVYLWIDVKVMAPTADTKVLSDPDLGTHRQQQLMARGSGVSMEFTDSAGTRWYRARNGVLHELGPAGKWQTIDGLPVDFDPPLAPDWLR